MKFKRFFFLLPLLSISNLFSQIDVLDPFPPLDPSIQICVGETTMECGEALVDFGEQVIGTQGNQQIVIKNTGNLTLIITDFALSGSTAFSLDTDPEGGLFLVVPRGGQATLEVRFTPSSVGLHEAELSIDYFENIDNPCTIRLSGVGIEESLSCLGITYSTDHGANWNPVNCGDEVYIDLSNNPLGELFPLRYVIQNDCEAALTISGETDWTWTNISSSLNPTLLQPGQIVQHSAGSAFLHPGNIYTYVTTFTTNDTPNPETCTITVVVDKQLDIGSGDDGKDKKYLGQKPIVFPTIATETIHLQLATSATMNYAIYDLNGKEVRQGKTNDFTTTISVSSLPPGSYFVKVANHPEVIRFVVSGK